MIYDVLSDFVAFDSLIERFSTHSKFVGLCLLVTVQCIDLNCIPVKLKVKLIIILRDDI